VSAPSDASKAPILLVFLVVFLALGTAMDSFEINKILGALLFTCLCLLRSTSRPMPCSRR